MKLGLDKGPQLLVGSPNVQLGCFAHGHPCEVSSPFPTKAVNEDLPRAEEEEVLLVSPRNREAAPRSEPERDSERPQLTEVLEVIPDSHTQRTTDRRGRSRPKGELEPKLHDIGSHLESFQGSTSVWGQAPYVLKLFQLDAIHGSSYNLTVLSNIPSKGVRIDDLARRGDDSNRYCYGREP
jgi:hypothetical protein